MRLSGSFIPKFLHADATVNFLSSSKAGGQSQALWDFLSKVKWVLHISRNISPAMFVCFMFKFLHTNATVRFLSSSKAGGGARHLSVSNSVCALCKFLLINAQTQKQSLQLKVCFIQIMSQNYNVNSHSWGLVSWFWAQKGNMTVIVGTIKQRWEQ